MEPAVEQLIDQYKEKTIQNRDMVLSLIECAKNNKMIGEVIQLFNNSVKFVFTDSIMSALYIIYNVYNDEIDYSKFIDSKPRIHVIHRIMNNIIDTSINNYYKDLPEINLSENDKQNLMIEQTKIIDLAIKYTHTKFHYQGNCICKALSKRLVQIKKYLTLGNEIMNTYDFSSLDFSNKHMRNVNINNWIMNHSNFNNTLFEGDGNTGTCIHWIAKYCDFTGAKFTGQICNKSSNYKGSNFTGVNLTTIMCNPGGNKMKKCNFTDAYVTVDANNKIMFDDNDNYNSHVKLYGGKLLKFLHNKSIPIDGSIYSSPQDEYFDDYKNGFDANIIPSDILLK